ncbi:hypothetical protein HOLleu_03709 [Holothuria leucospilota]|uniref:Uncharacterized protein n=1 Tax=Holothuria leucospilota TaxID=206669 RepID=A0A9Q1CSX3_HOLLE|nr:hypothetical protein HOLleu_03709 [Holothuria leucospilota]
MEALLLLDEPSICELVPKIGLRVKFLTKWKAYIEQDFQILYPEAAEKLYEKWPTLHQTMTVYADKNFPNWKEQLPWNCSHLDEEEQAFLSLPFVFQSRHKRKKGIGSASLTSSIRSFIDINPNITNIDDFCQSIVKEERPQPFLLVLWDEKQKTRQFFTVFERRCLLSASLLKAVDTCFKLHFVLDLSYQIDCFATWQFLQHFVFELFNDKAPELNCVRAFRAYYNSM